MTLVFAGACSHAPGITGRAERADEKVRDEFYAHFYRLGDVIRQSGAEALVVIAAEHFASFFKNNMPSFIVGMADYYTGPIEDEDWLGIQEDESPRQCTSVGTADPADHATRRRVIFAGNAIRPWYQRAFAFPYPRLRLGCRPGDHQLSGAASGANAPCLRIRPCSTEGD